MEKENLKNVLNKLIIERDYQDQRCILKGLNQSPSIEGELLMLSAYINKASLKCIKSENKNIDTLHEIRKIAGIAIRCLENHGCPKRDVLTDTLNGKN